MNYFVSKEISNLTINELLQKLESLVCFSNYDKKERISREIRCVRELFRTHVAILQEDINQIKTMYSNKFIVTGSLDIANYNEYL